VFIIHNQSGMNNVVRERGIIMSFYGVNKICQQCVRSCKQWKQCTPVVCSFLSNQKIVSDRKKPHTLTSGDIGITGSNNDHN
jgi:hypothetical protein